MTPECAFCRATAGLLMRVPSQGCWTCAACWVTRHQEAQPRNRLGFPFTPLVRTVPSPAKPDEVVRCSHCTRPLNKPHSLVDPPERRFCKGLHCQRAYRRCLVARKAVSHQTKEQRG